jgi:nitroimidazol reductase NimA-like FMN-containing flavoprotein (pyridoxamine 5'-phosphate oxidase superfamily)
MPTESAVRGTGDVPRFAAAWDEVSAAIETHETYLVSTVAADGGPHVTPVLGLWIDDLFYFNSTDASYKVRNLAHNPQVAVSVVVEHADFVIRGTAHPLLDVERLELIAAGFTDKYPWWHPRVRDGRFVDHDDNTSRTVFEVRPRFLTAFGRRRGLTASRWNFT